MQWFLMLFFYAHRISSYPKCHLSGFLPQLTEADIDNHSRTVGKLMKLQRRGRNICRTQKTRGMKENTDTQLIKQDLHWLTETEVTIKEPAWVCTSPLGISCHSLAWGFCFSNNEKQGSLKLFAFLWDLFSPNVLPSTNLLRGCMPTLLQLLGQVW